MTRDTSHPAKLRPYQVQGVSFLASRNAALLADEMGLGKTVQTAVALSSCSPEYRRILLVVPASLCMNWQRELEEWAPNLVVRRVMGDAEDRSATYRLPIRVLIASYEQVRADVQAFSSDMTFDLVIIDEAQRIKNSSSSTSLACRLIPRKRAWALSGTPLENEPDDIISIFRFLKPGLLDRGMSKDEIHNNVADHFLRRTKRAVLSELPSVNLQDLTLELGDKQRLAYDTIWASRLSAKRQQRASNSSAQMLATITKLKKICNFDPQSGESVKLDTLQIILESVKSCEEKIIIFSQYVETLRWIRLRIDIPSTIFHGGLSHNRRDGILSDFRTKTGARALLVSIKSGGVGLNLQEASTVVLFDRWWNPATENQAIQRAHRFGRTSPLHVVRFVTVNTIEERIAEILEEKKQLFEQYIEGAKIAEEEKPTDSDLYRILRISPLPAVPATQETSRGDTGGQNQGS